MSNASGETSEEAAAIGRHRRLQSWLRPAPYLSAALVTLLSINQFFGLGFGVGYTFVNLQYLAAILGLLLPLVFLLWPAWPGARRDGVPAYDLLLAALALAVGVYFVLRGPEADEGGWEYGAPEQAMYAALLLWAICLEAARRAGGWPIFVIILVISLYPLVADRLPGALEGRAFSLGDAARFHGWSAESVFGIPMRAFANIVLGFLIFGVALQHTGGGKFFIDLAFGLLGRVRGGPAKVAIFSSGLMGSMSGSVITNVMTTGTLSIPAMRRIGFSPAHAGAVEACASTGGVLMPPIMGATAFIMATFLRVPYIDVALAAVIPSFLYFFGLFIQIDAHAAQAGIRGLPKAEIPSLRRTLAEGWYFIAVFVLLVWMLVFLKREEIAPYYATALLLIINYITPFRRWRGFGPARLGAEIRRFGRTVGDILLGTGKLFAELAGLLAGIGLIIGALVMTGLSGSIANDLLRLAGGEVMVLLFMGAGVSFVLGIGMTVTAAYLFLAVALAPALVRGGLDPMAVHMFIFYWGMLSYITPPVALGAFAAATLSGARPMVTAFQAMKLGTVIYFIPFFFVLDTGLLFKGSAGDVLLVFVQATVGTLLVAGALQGYVLGVGSLTRVRAAGPPLRLLVALAGIALALPGGPVVGLSETVLNLAAAVIGLPALAVAYSLNRRVPPMEMRAK